MTSGKAALTLPSHDFVHRAMLKCISLMAESGSSSGCRQAKQIILAMNLLLLLLLFSPFGQFFIQHSVDGRL